MKINQSNFTISRLKAVMIALIILLGLTGCEKERESIKIAEQYGLAYAPLTIMKAEGMLEKALPGVDIEWTKLSNTMAIREAMLADDLDIGFVGIPPFLIAYDQGMPWKIITGMCISPTGLVVKEDIKTLKDLAQNGKIALPQPGSIQHILLSMAAEKTMGEADLFDHQLISMSHPDGYQAFISGTEIVAHFTAPPYLFQELSMEGNHLLVDGQEAMGEPFSFIVGAATEDFYNNEKLYNAFINTLEEAISFMNENRAETTSILAKEYELDRWTTEEYVYHKGMVYTTEVFGLDRFAEFMLRQGYLEKLPDSPEYKR